jgi:hypothetical protein
VNPGPGASTPRTAARSYDPCRPLPPATSSGRGSCVVQVVVVSTTAAPEPPLDRPVWVDLEAFWGPPDDGIAGPDDPVPGGLPVATDRVPGLLKRWVRSTDGRWFGRVNFKITDKYGAEVAEHVSELVPASALRPREPR